MPPKSVTPGVPKTVGKSGGRKSQQGPGSDDFLGELSQMADDSSRLLSTNYRCKLALSVGRPNDVILFVDTLLKTVGETFAPDPDLCSQISGAYRSLLSIERKKAKFAVSASQESSVTDISVSGVGQRRAAVEQYRIGAEDEGLQICKDAVSQIDKLFQRCNSDITKAILLSKKAEFLFKSSHDVSNETAAEETFNESVSILEKIDPPTPEVAVLRLMLDSSHISHTLQHGGNPAEATKLAQEALGRYRQACEATERLSPKGDARRRRTKSRTMKETTLAPTGEEDSNFRGKWPPTEERARKIEAKLTSIIASSSLEFRGSDSTGSATINSISGDTVATAAIAGN